MRISRECQWKDPCPTRWNCKCDLMKRILKQGTVHSLSPAEFGEFQYATQALEPYSRATDYLQSDSACTFDAVVAVSFLRLLPLRHKCEKVLRHHFVKRREYLVTDAMLFVIFFSLASFALTADGRCVVKGSRISFLPRGSGTPK
jgi:hypothetical protein